MNLTVENTTAENGMRIHSRVSLDIDAVGVEERPFFVEVTVNGTRLAHSFEKTRVEAVKSRSDMHDAYMEAHSARREVDATRIVE